MSHKAEIAADQMALVKARRDAERLSRVEMIAFVYKLRNGRYMATTTIDRHMVPGVLLETYLSGSRSNQ